MPFLGGQRLKIRHIVTSTLPTLPVDRGRHQHLRLLMDADHAHYALRGELEALEAALVMLKCAEGKLWYAVPIEEFMTPGLLAEMRVKL